MLLCFIGREGLPQHHYVVAVTSVVNFDTVTGMATSEFLFGSSGNGENSIKTGILGDNLPNTLIRVEEDKDGSAATVSISYLQGKVNPADFGDPNDFFTLATEDNTVKRRISNESIAVSGSQITRDGTPNAIVVTVTHIPQNS